MKRMITLIFIIILCISLPIGTGLASSPEVKPNQLSLYKVEEDNDLTRELTQSNNQNDTLKTNSITFSVSNMMPGTQQRESWIIANNASFPCYLDLEEISVVSHENGCLEPEIEAGDSTPDSGELQKMVNLKLFIDNDKNGQWNNGDVMIYNGVAGDVADNYDQNERIAADNNIQITALFDWLSVSNDNEAMSDDIALNVTFESAQTAVQ